MGFKLRHRFILQDLEDFSRHVGDGDDEFQKEFWPLVYEDFNLGRGVWGWMGEEEFRRYLRRVRRAGSEAMKADLFRDFVRRVFPDAVFGSIGGFYPELEKCLKVSAGGRMIRGRADSLFGTLIMEFESELDERHLREAENQLRKYSAGIWLLQDERKQKRSKLTCIATDGIKFKMYRPRAARAGGRLEARPQPYTSNGTSILESFTAGRSQARN